MQAMKSALSDFGDEPSLEALLNNGSRDDVADFVLKNAGRGFLYNYRDRIIPLFEDKLVRMYYGGAEGFDCNLDTNTMYRYAHVVNVVDRTYVEKSLLPLADATSCTPHVVKDTLRNNSF